MDEQAVRRDLLIAFQYAHNEEDWVTPVAEALAGVTAQEAAWIPGPDIKSIWEIVLHMTAWTDNIVERMEQRMRGERPGKPPEGDWPSLPATLDATTWENTQQRLGDALSAFRAHIEATPPAAMLDHGNAGYSHFDDLLCRFIHNAYHIGQITKLREWHAAQNPMDALWVAEAEARLTAYQAGHMTGHMKAIPAEDVFAEMDQQ